MTSLLPWLISVPPGTVRTSPPQNLSEVLSHTQMRMHALRFFTSPFSGIPKATCHTHMKTLYVCLVVYMWCKSASCNAISKESWLHMACITSTHARRHTHTHIHKTHTSCVIYRCQTQMEKAGLIWSEKTSTHGDHMGARRLFPTRLHTFKLQMTPSVH